MLTSSHSTKVSNDLAENSVEKVADINQTVASCCQLPVVTSHVNGIFTNFTISWLSGWMILEILAAFCFGQIKIKKRKK